MFAWWAVNKDYWRNCIPSYFFISVFKCCFNIFFFICSQTIKHTDSAAGLIKTKSRRSHVSDWSHAASSSSFIANSESRIVTVFVTVHVCCLFSVYFCVALMFTFMFLIFIFFICYFVYFQAPHPDWAGSRRTITARCFTLPIAPPSPPCSTLPAPASKAMPLPASPRLLPTS